MLNEIGILHVRAVEDNVVDSFAKEARFPHWSGIDLEKLGGVRVVE